MIGRTHTPCIYFLYFHHQALHEDDADPLLRATNGHPGVLLGRDLAERVLRADNPALHLRYQRRVVHQ